MRRAGIFNDTSISGHYGCTAVMGTILRELAARDVAPAYLWPVAEDWKPHAASLDRVRPDLIVVNGEGTIHHSAERKRTRDLIDLAAHARKLQVPAHLINASIEALDLQALEGLRQFTTIHVRETGSLRYLARHGIAARCVPDLSLGQPAPAAAAARSGILVTDSVLGEAARRLREFAAAVGAGHERMKPRIGRWEKLRRDMGRLVRRSPALREWRPISDPCAFIRRVAGAELVVTGRFHSVLLAILTDTPFVALASNTGKTEAVLMDVFGRTDRLIREEDLADPAFLRRLEGGLSFTEAERDALASYREGAARARATLFDGIVGWTDAAVLRGAQA
ncbi:polysaccharide pyruvyl transferase family protein [Cereibacter sphaeroides]|uniref:polysaccharide pyruvyl transferase family protein n=1 Tax=Cereibacter sphaeroides TaxID=1063 RepID=UPI000F51F24A|nr:polysaccharide pyruvyl transferase family protein [Cereibacter sphaeroides]AZB63904.1 polysaccharide pyruvyl transferase family protein [Cereibacter sphaeroides]AZB68173.1 polysaccharide pyruvyl transferase family protein [Cereibacter sphaeroides]